MEANILCEREEQTVLSNLFENLSALLQDCDDAEEKGKIKNTLRSMSDTTVYMTIGEEESGKTALLRLLVRLAAHVSNGCKSRIRPVVGRI